jgi:hypothetical protein
MMIRNNPNPCTSPIDAFPNQQSEDHTSVFWLQEAHPRLVTAETHSFIPPTIRSEVDIQIQKQGRRGQDAQVTTAHYDKVYHIACNGGVEDATPQEYSPVNRKTYFGTQKAEERTDTICTIQ